ncbi:DUF3006 domain-containing protein [Fuchsiella alkaliacetigena]|uniref:DUF3006 domain-containing protein n=1 Tax=Fuchsiella alkaliacetigena TaxID=957042 RepID=UPI00200B8EE6|nr:DUF3006 domain-containing protein [Fuchsiella alkaliacetigena]MCK8825965.1 DUF3006 domain-containing protein [Fuchsiella alkaliacetigena]
MQAVIDRFEGNYAVILVGKDEDQQLDVPKKLLPNEAQEGDCLNLIFEIDKDSTEQRKKRVEKLLDKLKNKD